MSKKITHSRIDFTGLPVKEVAMLLRGIASGILSELLDSSCPPGKPLPAASQTDLLKFLPRKAIMPIHQASIWKIKRKGPAKRIPGNMREDLSRSMKKLVKKTRSGKIKPKLWEIAANNRIALALGGTRGGGLPDDFWTVAAHWAWNDPHFKLSASRKIYQWLKSMRLLVPYEPPNINISPNTFWLLLNLTKIKPMKRLKWFSKKERARVRMARRLQDEAKAQTMTNEWADFWDQWLIQLASQRWPSGFKQLDSRLCKAVVALPLMNIPTGSTLCRGKKRFIPPFERVLEKVFDKWDGIKYLKRPAKYFRRTVLLNLSTRDWNLFIPEFFLNNRKETR